MAISDRVAVSSNVDARPPPPRTDLAVVRRARLRVAAQHVCDVGDHKLQAGQQLLQLRRDGGRVVDVSDLRSLDGGGQGCGGVSGALRLQLGAPLLLQADPHGVVHGTPHSALESSERWPLHPPKKGLAFTFCAAPPSFA